MTPSNRRLFGPLAVMAIGLVVLILALVAAPRALQLMNPVAAALPPMLGGMPIQGAIYAAQAVETIDEMHSLSFPLSSGAVGIYGPFNEAILYISGAPTERTAERMTREMTERIAEGGSPYTPMGEEIVLETRIYYLEGHGQQHFYFQAEKMLVWLAVDEWIAEEALLDCVQFYAGVNETQAD